MHSHPSPRRGRRTPRPRSRGLLLLLGAAVLLAAGSGMPAVSRAQGEAKDLGNPVPGKDYKRYDFDAGLGDRMHVKGYFQGAKVTQRILLMAPEGLSASIYFRPGDRNPGWADWFADQGWSVFALDLPGCAEALPPENPDIVNLTARSVEATYRAAMATFPQVIYAQGLAAAFVIKLRSTTPEAASGAILLDPIGPRGLQPEIHASPEQIAARRDRLPDLLWTQWGIGPRPGEVYPGSVLGEEGFHRLMESYDLNAPPYWAAVFTGLQTWLQVLNPKNISGWPVLVVRGPHPTAQMDRNREAVLEWLQENGAQVEEMDLGVEGPEGLSNLPMAGPLAARSAELFLEWIRNLPPNQRLPLASKNP